MAAQRPKWEQDQIKSFLAWTNFRWSESLKARGRPVVPLVDDINEDFKDGTKAAMLLMVSFGRSIGGIKKTGRHHDNIQNWAILINEMKKEGIDFRKGAPDMVSGDLQSTLAFQWACIRNSGSKLALSELFGNKQNKNPGIGEPTESLTVTQAADTSKQVSIKEQMLRYLNTYLPPELKVTNFTTSFQDGRVIKYLLNNLASVDVQDSHDPKTLLENCFSAAEHSLGIPTMFAAEDLALARVAEEPVMTYVISILQGIRNATEEGKKAAQASAAHLSALEGDSKGAAANDLPPPPPPMTDFPPPPPPITESVIPEVHPQSASFSVGHAAPMAVGGAMMAQGGPAHAGDQNYFGSIVQGSVMMELPEIFKIVAFGDFNNFVAYVNNHPNEIFTTAEPYRINVLFTAARITPHITAKKFLEFVLQRFPNAHMSADSKQNYPMHEALEYGCLENFDLLWNLPGAPRPPLVTLIHTAVWPTTKCIERVLGIVHQAHGGTIPPLDNFLQEGRTPLITALSTPVTSVEMVRVLLSRGSNPGFSSVEGQSPALVVAAACDKWDAVACMVRESLYQPLPLPRLLCALLFIVGVTPQTLTQFIRVTGAPTNEDDPQTGRTPLEHAVSLARADITTVLLQHGAQVNRISPIQPWRTPIHYALLYYAQDKFKYLDVVRVLQAWGADFNAFDANGQPASNYARNLGLPPNPLLTIFSLLDSYQLIPVIIRHHVRLLS